MLLYLHSCVCCALVIAFQGELGSQPPSRISPDQVDTQPIDVQTVDPPAEPSVLVSPSQSADDKRAAYQSKQKGIDPDKTRDFSKQHEPVKSKSKPKQKQPEDFTESDQEARALCQICGRIQKNLRRCKTLLLVSLYGFQGLSVLFQRLRFHMAGKAERSRGLEERPIAAEETEKGE